MHYRRVRRHPDHRHWAGMRNLTDEGSQQDHLLDVHLHEHMGDRAAERLPPEGRFLSDDQQLVALLAGAGGGVEPRERPRKAARSPIVDVNRGPALLEVEELLGIDHREGLAGVGQAEEIVDGARSRLARITPAFEGDDRVRPPQPGLGEATYRVHATRLPRLTASGEREACPVSGIRSPA